MRVLVAAGGSGGHVYPALAVLQEMRAQGLLAAAGWIGRPTGLEARVVAQHPWIQFFPLPSAGLDRRRPWTWPKALVQAGGAAVRSWAVLRRFAPDVVLGMGSYISVGPVLAAKGLRIPVVIHEQNVRLGLANRVLSRVADRVLLSYAPAKGLPRRAKAEVTGNPVRPEILQVPKELGEELLVFGGSLGSRALVEAAVQAAPEWARVPGLKARVIVGQAMRVEEVQRALTRAGLSAEVVGYEPNMAQALARARLVVARAGATTVAELAAAGRPALLVPWDGAAHGHQQENAQRFAQSGAGILLDSRDLYTPRFAQLVKELWTEEHRLNAMAAAGRAWARPEAAQRVAQALVRLVEASR